MVRQQVDFEIAQPHRLLALATADETFILKLGQALSGQSFIDADSRQTMAEQDSLLEQIGPGAHLIQQLVNDLRRTRGGPQLFAELRQQDFPSHVAQAGAPSTAADAGSA